MIGIRSAFSIRARGHWPHLEAVYMTAPRSVCQNTKKSLADRGPSINDVEGSSLPALPLLHARIERVARGIADQVDAEDRDREQQAGPEDQRGFYLKIRAALGHDIAPSRRFRTDAGAEKRQNSFSENGGGADVSALHDQRGNGVRHQMPPHDLGQAGAHRDRGFDVRLLTG